MKIFKLLSIADFFTMGNAIMGFTGMAIAIKSRHLEWAIACLFMGAILDGVDGIVARRFAKKWNLGDYLDIMCDYTTFCVAPSVIMLELFYDQHFLKFVHITPPFSNIMIYIACGAVLIAGLMRLSRFCYEPGSRVFFYGVASPGCAFTLSLVLLLYHIYDPTQPEYH
ncbi:MAG: CDP-alcohol phosphatidyltransferase family protein, partial [Thermoplasmata archaeon]